MPDQPQYKGIVERLTALQNKISHLNALKGLIWVLGLGLAIFCILAALTFITWPSKSVRLAVDLAVMLGLISSLYYWVIRPLVNKPGFLSLARLLETKYGKFQSRLIAALELHDQVKRNRENYSLELVEKTIEEAGGVIADIDTEAVIDYRPINNSLVRAGVPLLVILAVFLASPAAVYQAWLLYSNPSAAFEKLPHFALSVRPNSGEFYRNMDLAVTAVASGKTPREVDLFYKFEDGSWASEPMAQPESVTTASFVYTFKKIKRSLEFYAKSGSVESRRVQIDIVDPPRIEDISLKLDYPDYSGIPDAGGAPNDGNVTALKGTKVAIAATANKPIQQAFQLFPDSTRAYLNVNGKQITGQFMVKDNSRYTIIVQDDASRVNPEPIWYDIQALEDYPPTIDITFPGVDVDLNEQMALPLEAAITDDYGFGKLNLVYWMLSEGQQSEPAKIAIAIPDKRSLDQAVKYQWDLTPLNPLPGDLVYYYCEVSDNDIVSGPKWTKSRTYSARLPNLDEILADVQGAQEEQMESLEEALKSQKELQKQVEQLAQDMLKVSEVNYDKQQEARKVLEKQQDLAREMQNLAQEMEQNLSKLEDNKLIGEEIAEKMMQIQELMEQVAPPEMKEAMRKLQEALDKMDPNELKKALEQFQMTSKEFLENLERTLSLLEKLALEQKMDMMVQMAEKILADQNKINEKVNAAQDSASLAKQAQPQESAEKEFNTLKDQFDQFKKMDEQTQMAPEKEKSEADRQVNNPEIPQDMQDMKSSMCQNQGGNCKSKGKRLSKNLAEMTESLQNAQKAMQKQQKMEIARKMQKAAEDLLYLSNRQETLIDTTRTYENTGDGLRKLAGDQMKISGASSRVAEAVSELSKETVFINIVLMKLLGQTLSDMQDATNLLDRRFGDAATQSQQSAMSNLNKTVYLLFQARNNAMGSGSGSGMQEMMQQMQQMSQAQAGINQQTLMQMPQAGQQMSSSQQQSLQQLAGQQEMLRKQLQEMNDQYGKQGDMLGRLDQLGEEMKKVVDDLSKRKADRKTIERQEQILTRLLDAQKSVNRREYSRKRQSEQGEDIVRRSPALPEDIDTQNGWMSDMIKKALEEQYPREYEKLIRAYFKSFQSEGAAVEQE